jgi:hypothetical protein
MPERIRSLRAPTADSFEAEGSAGKVKFFRTRATLVRQPDLDYRYGLNLTKIRPVEKFNFSSLEKESGVPPFFIIRESKKEIYLPQ